MYSGQGLVTANSRSAAGSSIKYAAELNIVAAVDSTVVVCKENIRLFSVARAGARRMYSIMKESCAYGFDAS